MIEAGNCGAGLSGSRPPIQFYPCPNGTDHFGINPNGFRWGVFAASEKERIERVGVAQIIHAQDADPQFRQRLGRLEPNDRTSEALCQQSENAELAFVVLHLTTGCNLHCRYCFAAASADRGEMMPIAVARQALDRLLALAPHRLISIQFAGGEPLLAWPILKWAVEYGSTHRTSDGFPRFRFLVQTNGVLLDDDKVQFLKSHGVSLGVTLDGPARWHDTQRVDRDGHGSFDKVAGALKILSRNGLRAGSICVVADPAVLEAYPDFLLASGLGTISFNPVFSGQGRSQTAAPVAARYAEYADRMLRLSDRVIAHNRRLSRGGVCVRNLSVLATNMITRRRPYLCMRMPCGAGSAMLGVDVDGTVYPCEEMTGKPDLIIGNVFDDSIGDLLQSPVCQRLRARRPWHLPECKDCFARDVCEVSCANRSHNRAHDFTAKSEACDYYRRIVLGLLWRLHTDPQGFLQLL